VTPSQCVKVVKQYGAQSKTVLMTEPYRVAREIEGIGFKTADRIAINLGFANDAAPRLDAGLIFALETLQDDGHTAYREGDLIDFAAQLLETDLARSSPRASPHSSRRRRSSGIRWFLGRGALAAAVRDDGVAAPADSSPLSGSAFIQLPHNDRAEQKSRRSSPASRASRAGCRRSRPPPP
jgi:exodeoxyribonuclease V alpha subunit